MKGPEGKQPATSAEFQTTGADAWALRAFRELDDALLRLRLNHLDVGLVVLRTEGDPDAVLAVDRAVHQNRDHWLVREILLHQKRVLKRLDLTAKTFYALVEPGSCFAGSLAELVLASDRAYMRDDADAGPALQLGPLNAGALPMSNGQSRLQTRLQGEPGKVAEILAHTGPFNASAALAAGLITFAPDAIDWDDEVRLALEERASLSPDALTGLEANLRFAGPETLETKIFGRLTAWQNWIFQRPNAVGDKGALTVYGRSGSRPEFDFRRT